MSEDCILAAGFLFLGILFSFLPIAKENLNLSRLTSLLLGCAITATGAGLNIIQVLQVSASGFILTFATIIFTLSLGMIVGRLLKLEDSLTFLITAGTAICGGSAIAAVSTALKTDQDETSLALAIIFLLNFFGLILFPLLGHSLNLSEVQFGLWSAMAIHDTSSVIGANLHYGPQALEIATTVKLGRALWIAPVTILLIYLCNRKNNLKKTSEPKKFHIPWFIFGFLMMAFLSSLVNLATLESPLIELFLDLFKMMKDLSRYLFYFVFFLIGFQINWKIFKKVGFKPFALSLILWFSISIFSYMAIMISVSSFNFWI